MVQNNQNLEITQGSETQETGLAKNMPQAFPSVIAANSTKLAELIMQNIEKVKDNPAYIPQAEAVNSQIKSMIELGKAEIEMHKVSLFASR